jgi:hypothetical protein
MLIHRSGLYPITLGMQLGFYAVAAVGLATGARNMRIPAYLVLANFAVLAAWVQYARGERMTTWSPSERLDTLPRISTP